MRKYLGFASMLLGGFLLSCSKAESPVADFVVLDAKTGQELQAVEVGQSVIFRAKGEAELFVVYPGTDGFNYNNITRTNPVSGQPEIHGRGTGFPLSKVGADYELKYTYSATTEDLGEATVSFMATNVSEYGKEAEVALAEKKIMLVDYSARLNVFKSLAGTDGFYFLIDQTSGICYTNKPLVAGVAKALATTKVLEASAGSATVTIDAPVASAKYDFTGLASDAGVKVKVVGFSVRPDGTKAEKTYTLKAVIQPYFTKCTVNVEGVDYALKISEKDKTVTAELPASVISKLSSAKLVFDCGYGKTTVKKDSKTVASGDVLDLASATSSAPVMLDLTRPDSRPDVSDPSKTRVDLLTTYKLSFTTKAE